MGPEFSLPLPPLRGRLGRKNSGPRPSPLRGEVLGFFALEASERQEWFLSLTTDSFQLAGFPGFPYLFPKFVQVILFRCSPEAAGSGRALGAAG
ncbi:hypothetical protein, partial [Solidesulfovibrio sp.]|uniref:hypothetical protein n=1 Tax=Solidesulfovibrio sp. TaxID=2910990 RepID=UPI00261FFD91